MTALVWDEIGDRVYESGVDHGVLYLQDGRVAVWNGLSSIEEDTEGSELKSYYLDGVKFLQTLAPGDFSGKLKAFSYPEELDSVIGNTSHNPGFEFHNQPAKSFNMSYRTYVGNDVEGTEFGYKIHILYNIMAEPDALARTTIKETTEALEFGWTLTGTPPKTVGARPTVHVTIDSRTTPPDVLRMLEVMLYGNPTSDASLPSLTDIAQFFGYRGALIIADHQDGTWSAVDESDTYITMLDPTTFEIDGADTTIIDPDTYTIASTNVD